jgi:hypothetical protein
MEHLLHWLLSLMSRAIFSRSFPPRLATARARCAAPLCEAISVSIPSPSHPRLPTGELICAPYSSTLAPTSASGKSLAVRLSSSDIGGDDDVRRNPRPNARPPLPWRHALQNHSLRQRLCTEGSLPCGTSVTRSPAQSSFQQIILSPDLIQAVTIISSKWVNHS